MEAIFHGIYNPSQPASNGDGQSGTQVYIDGMSVPSSYGLLPGSGGGGGGYVTREGADVGGSRIAYITNGGGGVIASNDGFGWGNLPSATFILSKLGFYENKTSGEMGFYYPRGSIFSSTSKGHDNKGNMTGAFSGVVLAEWESALSLILSVIYGTAIPDAIGAGIGVDAQVVATGNASVNANVITRGPNSGSGALTCTIGTGAAYSKPFIPLAANTHVDGTKYFYVGNINNFTNDDFEGPYYATSFSMAVEGAYGAVTLSGSRDNNGALLIGVTFSIGVGLPFGYAGGVNAGKTFNITTWP
jgi:hypothetical protein